MILVRNLNSIPYELDYHLYMREFKRIGDFFVNKTQSITGFVVDQHNEDIINNMYLWLIRHKRCPWDFDKAFYLCGAIGSGKTTLMKIFLEIIRLTSNYYIPTYQSYTFYEEIKKYGLQSFKTKPIFIDELGREQLELFLNGVRVRPIEDLIGLRYEYGAATFFTSNFKLETLSQGYDENGKKIGYGKYIGDRIAEMCNIIVLPGTSRRK